jgi:hypothetical protein
MKKFKKKKFILLFIFILFLVKILEYYFSCHVNKIEIKPVWESNVEGLLEIKGNSILVHKNSFFVAKNEDQILYQINKNNGIITDSIKQSVNLKKEPTGIIGTLNPKTHKRFFLSDYEDSKVYLTKYKEFQVNLYYYRSFMRCNNSSYSIQFYKLEKLEKEVFIDYISDFVNDKESVFILRHLPINNKRIVKYNFSEMLK